MNHTPQIKKALQFAARKHDGHYRMESEKLPYLTHLVSAAILVAEDGDDDEVVIATLLHDTIEDTETTREEIAEAFGERVASLVVAVSEPKGEWRARKEAYLAQLAGAPDDALLISIADKIDNIESKLEAFEREGKELLGRWKRPLEDYFWYHGEVARMATERLPEHRLTKRLVEVHARERAMLSGL